MDGPLLLRLTDDQLKKDLGILPLGHRSALLQAVAKLKEIAPPLEGGAVTGKVGGWVGALATDPTVWPARGHCVAACALWPARCRPTGHWQTSENTHPVMRGVALWQ